jgi:hypothetical protein
MRRALAYFAAFTGMGALFGGDEGMFGMVTALIVVAE